MKKYLLLLFLLCIVSACSEGDNGTPSQPDPVPEPEITLRDERGQKPVSLSVASEQTVMRLTLTCNNDWTMTADTSWLQVMPASGKAGTCEVTVTVDANSSAEQRSTYLVVRCASLTSRLKVTQEGYVPLGIGALPNDPAIINGKGGETTIEIASPGDWTLESDQDWISVSPSSGQRGEHQVAITTHENTQGCDRRGHLVLTSGKRADTLTIDQNCNIFTRTYLKSRDVEATFTLVYPKTIMLARTLIVFPYPESNEYQTIRNSQYGDMKVGTSSEGVNYLYSRRTFSFPASGKPAARHSYTVDYYHVATDFDKVTHPDLPYDQTTQEYQRYTSKCVADRGFCMIDPTNAWIMSRANELWESAGGNRISYARLCYEYVARAFSYGMYSGDNSVEEIISRMSGDCGNQHAIWLSLMRAKGIPARPIVMNSPENFSHVRGEFYLPGYGWIPVDVTYHQGNGGDYFGKFTDDNLVVMNRDFSFTVTATEQYHCNLLQSIMWYFWIYSGNGNDLSGQFQFGYSAPGN